MQEQLESGAQGGEGSEEFEVKLESEEARGGAEEEGGEGEADAAAAAAAEALAEELVEKAIALNTIDNVSAVVVRLPNKLAPAAGAMPRSSTPSLPLDWE